MGKSPSCYSAPWFIFSETQWKHQKYGTHICVYVKAGRVLLCEGSCCNYCSVIWVCLGLNYGLAIPVSLSYALTQPSWNFLALHRLLRYCRSNQSHPSCQQYTRRKGNLRYLDQHLWFTSYRCSIFVAQSYVFLNSYDHISSNLWQRIRKFACSWQFCNNRLQWSLQCFPLEANRSLKKQQGSDLRKSPVLCDEK